MVGVNGQHPYVFRFNDWLGIAELTHQLDLPKEWLPFFTTAPLRTAFGPFVSIGPMTMIKLIGIENEVVVEFTFVEGVVTRRALISGTVLTPI